MSYTRKIALITGVFFIITFAASIPPAFVFYKPVLNDVNYVLGGGADTRIYVGAFFEVILAIAGIGTAVTLFPILKRQNEGIALGYVAARTVESTVIVVGLISLLSVVTLRQDFSGADAATFVIAGKTLVAIHKWTFLLGPGFCPGIENGLMLGYLMYRSRLVPRPWAVLGLVAGILAIVSAIAELFGLFPQVSAAAFILVLPEAIWEAFLGIYLTVRGFRPAPILSDSSRTAAAVA